MATTAGSISIVGERAAFFWAGCAAISGGVLLHLPMLAMAHSMGNHLSGMPMDGGMWLGMALIAIGVPLACFGALPKERGKHADDAGLDYEAPDNTSLGRWHAATLLVLTLGLIIDVMKPATLGFVLPGLSAEYRIAKSEGRVTASGRADRDDGRLFPVGLAGRSLWAARLDPSLDHLVRFDGNLRRDAGLRLEPRDVLPDGHICRRNASCDLYAAGRGHAAAPSQLGAGAGRRDRTGWRLPRGEQCRPYA